MVSLSWWREHRGDVLLADVRWYLDGRSGRDAYAAGHLPGAVFVDLDRWLARPASPEAGRHPLPDPAVFADGMARLGIADDSTVVAYDDAGGTVAARLVWMLRATGHPAALLDGGFQAYDGPPDAEHRADHGAGRAGRPAAPAGPVHAASLAGRPAGQHRGRGRSGSCRPGRPRPGPVPR